jgi:hypothetical protein
MVRGDDVETAARYYSDVFVLHGNPDIPNQVEVYYLADDYIFRKAGLFSQFSVTLSEAKGLYIACKRCFAALSMTYRRRTEQPCPQGRETSESVGAARH